MMINTEAETSPQAVAEKPKGKKPQGIFAALKKVKHIELIAAGVAVAVMLIIYFSATAPANPQGAARSTATLDQDGYCAKMERELAETLSKMEGAGETRVIVNWESSVEAVIAYITNSNNNGTAQSPQIITGGGTQGPVVLKEIYPKAIGVVIMSQGGENVKVKLDIINAVSVLLSITPDKIQVLTMKK